MGPSAVLTAAHCSVIPSTNTRRPLSELYIVYGVTEVKDMRLTGDENLVKVAKVHVAPQFGANAAFPSDGDLAVWELSRCVDIVPGESEYIRIANPDTEKVAECTKVRFSGFGGHSNLHWSLSYENGKLRTLSDFVHSDAACRAVFTRSMLDTHGYTAKDLEGLPVELAEKFRKGFDPGSMKCSGGDSSHSLGFGDGGVGAVVDDPSTGEPLLVGVSSYTTDMWYGRTPEYWTRVARFYTWIRSALDSISSSCGSWKPLDVLPLSRLGELPPYDGDNGRCPMGKWQCPRSIGCIDRAQVCDGTPDCTDKADEAPPHCNTVASIMAAADDHPETDEDGATAIDRQKVLAMFKHQLDKMAASEKLGSYRAGRSAATRGSMVVLPTVRRSRPQVKHKAQAMKGGVDAAISCDDVDLQVMTLRDAFIAKADSNDVDALETIVAACRFYDHCALAADPPELHRGDLEDMCLNVPGMLAWQATLPDWRLNFSEQVAQQCWLPEGQATQVDTQWYNSTPLSVLAVIGLAAILIFGA